MITLSETATNNIKLQLQKRGSGLGIRLGVLPTGCSGLSYVLEFVDIKNENDQEVIFDGFSVFIDDESAKYLKGTTLDFVKTLTGEGFEFKNPNEKAKCGCGESFIV